MFKTNDDPFNTGNPKQFEAGVEYYTMMKSCREGDIDTSSLEAQKFLRDAFPNAENFKQTLGDNAVDN